LQEALGLTATPTHDKLLGQAKSALELLDNPVRKNAFGDVDGVDDLSIALDRMTDALVSLVDYPRTSETTLEDVVAFMSPGRILDPATNTCLFHVREGIKLATYTGVSTRELDALNRARVDLRGRLQELITTHEGQGDDA
jgi:hypothetical protein